MLIIIKIDDKLVKSINNSVKKQKEKQKKNLIETINEQEIYPNFLNLLIPNYNKELEENLKLSPVDALTEEFLKRDDIYIFEKDTTFSEFQSLPRYKEYRIFKYFSCGECIFVDKFGNINFRVYFTIRNFQII